MSSRGILPAVPAESTQSRIAASIATCPNCAAVFTDPDLMECPHDGAKLTHEGGPQTLVDRVVGGRYRIVSRLGEGGMGTVYAAEHTLSQRRVALKIVRAELESSSVVRARFLRECKALERVQSPNVVSVLESGESAAGEIYLVMELLEGETLGERIERGAIPIPEVLSIGSQIASALRAAHAKDVVHRDLKPDNVFLCLDGTVRVLDFGIARLLHGDTRGDEPLAGKLTRTGTIVGTPAYISPEGAAGDEVGPAADLYSLGVVLFEMLTGALPFSETQPVLLMGMHMKDAPPSLTDARRDVPYPPELVSLVARLLAKRPADRPTSAEAVIAVLDALRARGPHEPASETRLMAVIEPERPRAAKLVLAALAASAIALMIAIGVTLALWPEEEAATTTLPVAPVTETPEPELPPPPVASVTPAVEPPPEPPAEPPAEPPPEPPAEPEVAAPEPAPSAPAPPRARPRREPDRRGRVVRDYF